MFGRLGAAAGRAEIGPLPLEADPTVEAGAGRVVDAHVPLADEGSLVAGALQVAGKGVHFMAERAVIGVVRDAVRVGVEAGEKAAAAGRAEGRGDEGVLKLRALARDAVDIRCADEWLAAAVNVVPAGVIHQNDDEIRAHGGGRRPGRANQRQRQIEEQFSAGGHRLYPSPPQGSQ